MDSRRQQKFSKLILKELSEVFLKDAKSLFKDNFITITNVSVSPDLGQVKVFLSFLLTKDKEASLGEIREKSKILKQYLGTRIRNQVRSIPELLFFYDDSMEYSEKINRIITNLNIPPAEENQ